MTVAGSFGWTRVPERAFPFPTYLQPEIGAISQIRKAFCASVERVLHKNLKRQFVTVPSFCNEWGHGEERSSMTCPRKKLIMRPRLSIPSSGILTQPQAPEK